MNEKELVHELVLESREHLQSVEPDLLDLEREGDKVSDELINRVFRAVHSIKGGFAFFGIKKITDLSHAMENVLSRLRDHSITASPSLTDALLKGIDKIRVLLDDIEKADEISIESELNNLLPFRGDVSNIQHNEIQSENETDIFKIHSTLDLNQIKAIHKEKKHLYNITLTSKFFENKDLDPISLFDAWIGLGDIIDMTIDHSAITGLKESSASDVIYHILFSSVLESDLVSTGCKIDDNSFKEIDLNQIINKQSSGTSVTSETQPVNRDNSSETRTADSSLRVKLNLLNNLMNLAGELVLSRNQLLLQFNRKLIEAIYSDQTELDQDFDLAIKSINEHMHNDSVSIAKLASVEIERLKHKITSILSIPMKDVHGINSTLQSIDTVTSLLQENIMQTRLQPISVVFNKFPRVARDLSHKLGKDIRLEMSGQDVELDKSIVELLSDPLTHLVRNSADHGIEDPQTRKEKGKPPTGTITLLASQEGGKVIVEISDDGKGIDVQTVKEAAIAKGLITEKTASEMSVHEIQKLILHPGFSTAKQVTDISGRGVGMDVVKSNIERLSGTINIESTFGLGTRITLTLPLTLAIIPTLIVSSEGQTFAIPQVNVEELVRIRSFELTKKIERVHGAEVTRLRGKLLPLVRLSAVLSLEPTFIHPVTGERLPDRRARWSDRRGKPSDNPEDDIKDERRTGKQDRRENKNNAVKIVVLKVGQHLYGLVVDSVYESEEIVVKPLPDSLKSTQCYTGSTIMGDGKVALILDPGGISNKAGLHFVDQDQQLNSAQELSEQNKVNESREFLVFDNGTTERFALDLHDIARIEQAKKDHVETIGNREFINRDGSSLPVIRIHNYLPVNNTKSITDDFFVIIPRNDKKNIGIIASQVYDTVSMNFNIDTNEIKGNGILGSAVINDKLTIILDIPSLINAAQKGFEVANA